MKKTMTRSGYVAALLFCLLMTAPVAVRELPPILSTEWLAANLEKPGMVLLDIRKVEYYLSGHIPGAVNAFYSAWTVKKVDLYTEIPERDDLFDLIGEAGINGNSRVVIIGKADTPQERVCMARVACALEYGGVKNVAILDGGHNQWVRENRVISQGSEKPTSKIYSGQIDRKVL